MPRAAARGRRATTTRAFLFCDLRGYTAFVEAHGDAAAARLLRDYRTLVRREVARHAGAEIKTEGDSFYVVFESPSAAIECAVAILRRAEAHTARTPERPLRIGFGLHAGETVAFDEQFVGSAVNIAARLAAAASESELLISDTLRGLVRTSHAYELRDRGALELKGLSERVRAWSVRWADRPQDVDAVPAGVVPEPLPPRDQVADPGQLVCPVLVGRDAELARIREQLERVSAGEGRSVLVAGEAGVGKTALIRETVRLAGAAGFRAIVGATLESDDSLPYAPFIAAMRSSFRGRGRSDLARFLATAAPDLAQLFPELGGASTAPGPAGALERHRLTTAFREVLGIFVRDRPVLLVLEDLHWADASSLELFTQLARQLRETRLLLLATYRSDELHRKHPLVPILAVLRRERLVAELPVARLTPPQLTELIRATFARSDPAVQVGHQFSEAIYARSEGNPFFTEELLRALVGSGDVFYRAETGWDRKPIDELKVPSSVRDAVLARLEGLAPGTRATLSAAAVAGQRFSFDLVRAVRAIGDEELLAQLREGIEQQLVVEHAAEDDVYAFRHALTREVIYDELLGRERKLLHRGIAAALALDASAQPASIAHHLIEAGDAPAAAPLLLEAARRAAAADAPREAVAHYERALDLGAPLDEHPAIYEQLAEAYQRYDLARSRRAAEEAVRLYRERADARGASRALVVASWDAWRQGDVSAATAIAEEARRELEHEPESAELGRATAHLAQLRLTDLAKDEARALADRAIVLGERSDDAWTTANALITKGSALPVSEIDTALELTLRGRDLAMARGLVVTATRAATNAAVLMLRASRPLAERLAAIDDGIAYARRHGDDAPVLLTRKIDHLAYVGRWDEALALAEQVDPDQVFSIVPLWHGATIALARSGPAAALPLYLEAAERAVRANESQWYLGGCAWAATACALAGDARAAADWYARLMARLDEQPGTPAYLATVGGRSLGTALLAALACERVELVELVDRAREPTAGDGASPEEVLIEATKDLLRGGAPGPALDAAYDRWRELGSESWVASLVVLMARLMSERRIAPAAGWAAVSAKARAFGEGVGAAWWLSQLDRIPAPHAAEA